MSNYQSLDKTSLQEVGKVLEKLGKSFAAGYQGLQNAGRTGVGALAIDSVDPVLKSITMTNDHLMLTKDIKSIKASQTVYQYKVKTAAQTNMDLAGTEAFLPMEDQAQYLSVAEVLKVYGIRKSLTQMAQFVNDASGYVSDIEKENDINASLAMASAMERDLYLGGDFFMSTSGAIDPFAANQMNGAQLRQVRGIQANIREGDVTQRGIPGDFIGFGNSRSVVFDRKGGVMERGFLDQIATSVQDNLGVLDEGHCTSAQLTEFRATFFPIERADISALYAIRGPAISNEPKKVGITVDSVCGPIDLKPNVFKYSRAQLVPVQSSVGTSPSTPSATGAAGSSATGSGFVVGEVYSYRVQAVSIAGRSYGSTPVSLTVTTSDAPNDITITNAAGVEYYAVYRTAKESNGAAGKEMWIGNIVPQLGGSTVFRDNGRVVPGLDSVLFMPRNEDRVMLAVLGNVLNKMDLGLRGLASEKVYSSYFACVVTRPRSLALADNVYQLRSGI